MWTFEHFLAFVQTYGGLTLRAYQAEAARAILDSVLERKGLSLVVMFPRQSGKNELQAQIEAYLLAQLCAETVEMVKASPTWKPQSLNAMRRLERVLGGEHYSKDYPWQKEQGYVYRCGLARLTFLSGAPVSNIVGATASLLLELDEAQDISEQKYDKDLAPMAASANATRVFWGTAWTSQTLLARELRLARQLEAADGIRRAFVTGAERVAAEAPAYGRFVVEQVRRFGRQHPLVRTQYYSEELDSGGGLFSPDVQARLRGGHSRRTGPDPHLLQTGAGGYALLIDVGGIEEGATGAEALRSLLEDGPAGGSLDAGPAPRSGRDSTALTVVEVHPPGLGMPSPHAPLYHIVHRQAWVGVRHSELHETLCSLARRWQARYIVIDSTGVGAGLASFLAHSLPGVLPFTFSAQKKSDLGWRFLSMINENRIKDWAEDSPANLNAYPELYLPAGKTAEYGPEICRALFWLQVDACQGQVVGGPRRLLHWGVPDGRRDPQSGVLVHDDLLISAGLCAVLDEQNWQPAATAQSHVMPGVDPLAALGEVF